MDDAAIKIFTMLVMASVVVYGVVNHVSKKRSTTFVHDLRRAREFLGREAPDFTPGPGVCSHNGSAAVFLSEGGDRLGLVMAGAQGWRAAVHARADCVIAVSAADRAFLEITLPGETEPATHLFLAKPGELEEWTSRLQPEPAPVQGDKRKA
ncbi:hypothetical protein FKB34_01380 [Glycocaulis profundi]|nr:hypothetical protein FKB34_01380 [Glycocaulis profundi]